MNLTARLYKVNKGKNVQHAHFATMRRDEVNKFKIKEGDALIFEINEYSFPTMIRKLKTRRRDFMLGFTVPHKIGEKLKPKKDYNFTFIKRGEPQRIYSEEKNSVNLPSLIPHKSIRGNNIFLFDDGNQFLVWIYSKGNKIARLPKKIPLTESKYDLLELAGVFFCEGFKSRKPTKHRDRFSFSNAEKSEIVWFLSAVESLLHIRKSEWNAQILYPVKGSSTIQRYWSSIGISEQKISVIYNPKTNMKSGVCILNIYNSSLAESLYYIFKKCRELALQSKKYAMSFFRGLSRGDMGIGENFKGTITFTTESKENALFVMKLCSVMGVKTTGPFIDKRGQGKGCWNIYIHRYENFEMLIKNNCIVHKKRKKNMYHYFINARGSTSFQYLHAISKGHNTYRKLLDHMDIGDSTAGTALLRYLQEGYLTRTRGQSCYEYQLSEKGKEVLNFYQRLNGWLTESDKASLLS
jgi:hypothetical protein